MNAAAEAATLRDAITCYHDLLGDDRLAAESWQMLEAGHRSRGMYFGERPLCSVLRPRFLTPAQYREISSGVERVMGAFRRAYDAAMADAAFRARVLRTKTHVTQEATKLCAELFALSGGRHYRRTSPLARAFADAFAGTALRPPLPLGLDSLVEQFSLGEVAQA